MQPKPCVVLLKRLNQIDMAYWCHPTQSLFKINQTVNEHDGLPDVTDDSTSSQPMGNLVHALQENTDSADTTPYANDLSDVTDTGINALNPVTEPPITENFVHENTDSIDTTL